MIAVRLIKTITEDPKIIRVSFKSKKQDKDIVLGSIVKFSTKELIPHSVIDKALSKIYNELFNETTD